MTRIPGLGLGLMLLLHGCTCITAPPSHSWRVPEELTEPFEAAARDWCNASDGLYCPYRAEEGDQQVLDGSGLEAARGRCGWYAGHPREIHIDVADITAGGCFAYIADPSVCGTDDAVHPPTDSRACWREATVPELIQGVLAHELGHAAGIAHLEDPLSLMHGPNWSVRVTRIDVEAL